MRFTKEFQIRNKARTLQPILMEMLIKENAMALLKNKKIMWTKLSKPEESFDKSYTYWSTIILIDQETSNKMKKAGMSGAGKTTVVDGQEVPSIKMNRKTHWKKSGDAKSPVRVVDMYGQDIDPRVIGNGSIANVQYTATPYDFNGRKGRSVELVAIQIVDLIEYKGGNSSSSANEFDFLAREEVVLDTDVPSDDLDLGSDDIFE